MAEYTMTINEDWMPTLTELSVRRSDMKRGDTITVDGKTYFVTRVDAGDKRGQIDLINVDEAIRRRDELNDLINNRQEEN